jgi:hypothetical protein
MSQRRTVLKIACVLIGVRMSNNPTLDEIVQTVVRLEQRFERSSAFTSYRNLLLRFEADLTDPRDLALAKSAALMLVKQLEDGSL